MSVARNLLAFVLASMAWQSAPAQPQSSATGYKVDLELFDGDTLIGRPAVTVGADQPVIMTTERPDGYALKITVSPTVGRAASVDTQMEIRFNRNGKYIDISSPTIRSLLGNSVHFETGKLPQNGQRPLKLNLSVSSVVLSAATAQKLTQTKCQTKQLQLWHDLPAFNAQPRFIKVSAQPGAPPCCRTKCITCCGNAACCVDSYGCPGGGCCTHEP